MPVNLIPKKKGKKAVLNVGALFRDIQTTLAIGVLILTGLVYFGLSFYEKGLNSEVESIVLQAEAIVLDRDADLENDAQSLSKRIKAIEKLLDSHTYSSNIFTVIEDITHPSVYFSRFTFSVEKENISLDGLAPNYKTLGEQIIVLEEDSRFNEVKLSNFKSEKSGEISFTVNFEINEEVYKLDQQDI